MEAREEREEEIIHHPLRLRHGDTELIKRRKCFALFTDDEYLIRKNRETRLEGRVEGEETVLFVEYLLLRNVLLLKLKKPFSQLSHRRTVK